MYRSNDYHVSFQIVDCINDHACFVGEVRDYLIQFKTKFLFSNIRTTYVIMLKFSVNV